MSLFIIWLAFICDLKITNSQCRYIDSNGAVYPIDKCAMSYSDDSFGISVKYTCINMAYATYGVQQIVYQQPHCEGLGIKYNMSSTEITFNCQGSSSDCRLVDFEMQSCESSGESQSTTLVAEICSTGGTQVVCSSTPPIDLTPCNNYETTTTSAPFSSSGCDFQISQCYGGSSGSSTGETNETHANAAASGISSMIIIICVAVAIVIVFIIIVIICCTCSRKKKAPVEKEKHRFQLAASSQSQPEPVHVTFKASVQPIIAVKSVSGTTAGGHGDELPSYADVAMVPSAPSAPIEDATTYVLPYGWSQAVTSDGKTYYQNDITKQTQWDKPVHVAVAVAVVNEDKTLPHGWRKAYASDGRVYYLNDITKQTQWTFPTISANNNQPGAIGNDAPPHGFSTDGAPGFNRMETTGQEGGGGPSAPLIDDMDMNGKYIDVKKFFYNQVCIDDYNDKYIALMIDNGFDNLNILKTLTIQDLVHIGVDKLGHRKKIMNEIDKL